MNNRHPPNGEGRPTKNHLQYLAERKRENELWKRLGPLYAGIRKNPPGTLSLRERQLAKVKEIPEEERT